jgi:hypothetical protein
MYVKDDEDGDIQGTISGSKKEKPNMSRESKEHKESHLDHNDVQHEKHKGYDSVPEHVANAGDWALPVVLAWLPPELLVWTVGLLLSEAKVVVVGVEGDSGLGLVSAAVMGLVQLLQPLVWVAPLIPVLPLAHGT